MQFGMEQTSQWQWGLESIGTIGAAFVALGIALREVFIRGSDRRARARIAAMTVWPDLRKYLAALKALGRHDILVSGKVEPNLQYTVQRIVGALQTDAAGVAAAARDLDQPYADMLARVIANVRHATRHTLDLMMENGTLENGPLEAKQAAIRKALDAARSDLIPLIRYTRGVGMPQKTRSRFGAIGRFASMLWK